LPDAVRRDLAETILEESRRMTRLVANLLDMVRVETGGLAVRKDWQPLEEALGVALLRLEDRLKAHPVVVRLPGDLPLVPIDELLVEQVFINLLENAAKHTGAGTDVTVSAWQDGAAVVVEVADGRSRRAQRRRGDRLPKVPARPGGGSFDRGRTRPHHLPRDRCRSRRPHLGRAA
jgi:two-component system, OmpR family, sensor histidine kinase KdpD